MVKNIFSVFRMVFHSGTHAASEPLRILIFLMATHFERKIVNYLSCFGVLRRKNVVETAPFHKNQQLSGEASHSNRCSDNLSIL
jgi:hypothetical protein